MDIQDETLISELIPINPELKQLVDSHRNYKLLLEEFNKRPFLSAEDEVERKRIQKAKLAGKDKIELILARNRK